MYTVAKVEETETKIDAHHTLVIGKHYRVQNTETGEFMKCVDGKVWTHTTRKIAREVCDMMNAEAA
jgi:hypothetical protein